MKTDKENTLITDWLDEYGNPEIEELAELKLFKEAINDMVVVNPNDMVLGNKIREFIENYSK